MYEASKILLLYPSTITYRVEDPDLVFEMRSDPDPVSNIRSDNALDPVSHLFSDPDPV